MAGHTILQIISSAGLYGAERVVLELAAFWRGLGWRSLVGVFSSSRGAQPEVALEARRRGLETLVLQVRGHLDGAAMVRLSRRVADEHVELVHSHGYRTDVFLGLARLPAGVRRVATCHTWYSRTPRLLAYELADKLVLHRFDLVVTVSPQLHQEVLAAGLPEARCAMIENGLLLDAPSPPPRLLALRRELGLREGDKLILRVGRLDADKGNDVLLRALAPLLDGSGACLCLAGDGDERPALERLARELRLGDRIIFAGYRREVADLLAAADLFVISSIKEGLPMVLLEAMAAGCPIVATAVGAIPRVIEDGVEGLLVGAGDVAALRAGVRRLLDEPQEARAMAERARRRFEERHSRKAMGERYRLVFERLLAPSAQAGAAADQNASTGPMSGAAPLTLGPPEMSSTG